MIESEFLSRKFIEKMNITIEYTELSQYVIDDLFAPHSGMTKREPITRLDKQDD